VASSGSEEDFATLQSMVDKLAAAVDDDWVELTKLDLQFHLTLVAAADSPRLDRMFRTLVAESQLCIARLEPFYTGRGEVVSEHQEIIDAIQARDLDLVDRLVAAHMDVSAARLTSAEAHVGAEHT
jgi:DNA-binding GntR family transcriptional regulator